MMVIAIWMLQFISGSHCNLNVAIFAMDECCSWMTNLDMEPSTRQENKGKDKGKCQDKSNEN